uniref:Cytochrome P450 n=1 Tax=Leersia perrieri TaxID=77586 RepID=A0A0D9VHH7_9ORYZ
MESKMLLALGLSVLIIAIISKLISLATKPRLNLPPGPWTLPVIGSIHHLVRNPSVHRAVRALSEKHGPLMQLWLGEVPIVVASTPEVVQEIVKNLDLQFADRHLSTTSSIISFGASDIFFAPYGELWRQLRKLSMQELLSAARVRSFQRIREDEVGGLVREIAAAADAGAAVNLTERASRLVNDVVTRCSVGERCRYRDEFLDALDTAKSQLKWLTVADIFPSSRLAQMVGTAPRKALAGRTRMLRIIDEIIRERKEQMAAGEDAGKECFIDVLLKLEKEGGTSIQVTTEIVVVLIFDVFTGGSESSSTVLIWILTELVRWPRVMAKAQVEIRQALKGKSTITEDDIVGLNYLKMVIKETLRLHVPAPFLSPRKCRETCKVMGYDVPKGTSVFVNMWAICRDPRYWEDPEEFKPERFENNNIDYKGNNFEFIPFGAGRRICPGINLALANLELALASLIYHFDWKLPNEMEPKDLDIRETVGITAAKLTSLDLCPITRIDPRVA